MSAQTVAQDNEARSLSLNFAASADEGSSVGATLAASGQLASSLTVTLSLDNGGTVSVPATVTIPAGQSQAVFQIDALDNALKDGSRTVGLSVSAPSFSGASRSILVRDNEVDGYRFNAIGELVNISSPVSLTVFAVDVEGNVIASHSGVVNLRVALPDGSTLAPTPGTATLSNGSWTGTVTVPSGAAAPLRFRATGGGGVSSETNPFDVLRVLSLTASDLCWDEFRGVLYASVPTSAGGTDANQVVAIDPETLQVGRRLTGVLNPGRLALTSGGEYLYATVNGGFTIARINPATLSVESTFAVGTDPSYGTLYAEDMCTVAGQPNLLVVSQYRTSVTPRHNGVAAYDNGVIRPTKTQNHTGSNVIEPSSDPSVFFGYNTESTEYGFRRLQLGAGGMTQIQVASGLFSGFSTDFRTAGDVAVNTVGVVVDGARMRRLGTLSLPTGGGLVCPEAASGRVYFLERQSSSSSTYDKLSAHDLRSLYMVRRMSLPAGMASPAALVRWGRNGLAFRSGGSVVVIHSSLLVPADPPEDLATTVEANPLPARVNEPLTYTVRVSNPGTNEAVNVVLGATLSSDLTIQGVSAGQGQAVVSGSSVRLDLPRLAPGSELVLTVATLPQIAGIMTCSASASSGSRDPDFSNNLAVKAVGAGFSLRPDTVTSLKLGANNLVYDPSRSLLWATVPSTVDPPLGKSLISIDPQTGLVSDPIAIGANPVTRSIALSANGRYLYVGLTDSPEVYRADLQSSPVTGTRIPLGNSQWGDPNYAQDIEVLDGDGTSILVAGSGDHAAAVYDGVVRRTARTGIYTVDRIERGPVPGRFLGYNNYTTGFGLTDLSVTASGVAVSRTVSSLISGFGVDIKGGGSLLLSSSGLLVDASALALLGNLGVSGRPCLDVSNQRAYLVNGNALRGFDTGTRLSIGNLPLPVTSTGDWARDCLRWGRDGIAILGGDDKIHIARWSKVVNPSADQDANGVLDMWESAHGGPFGLDLRSDDDGDGLPAALEYGFGSSPTAPNADPSFLRLLPGGPDPEAPGDAVYRVVYPRRQGINPDLLALQSSHDLVTWAFVVPDSQNVISSELIDGVAIDWIQALLPIPDPAMGFVRLVWKEP